MVKVDCTVWSERDENWFLSKIPLGLVLILISARTQVAQSAVIDIMYDLVSALGLDYENSDGCETVEALTEMYHAYGRVGNGEWPFQITMVQFSAEPEDVGSLARIALEYCKLASGSWLSFANQGEYIAMTQSLREDMNPAPQPGESQEILH